MARVLLLEDDPMFRCSLEQVLAQFGHQVVVAESADQAVAQAREQAFDLLLSDVRIAGEVDGVEALGLVRRILPQIRSIIMTGYADSEAPLRAAKMQADDYLLKPFKIPALVHSINEVLSREQPQVSLLERISSAPGQAAQKALRWLFDAKLQQLEEVRQQSMDQFYLLIRSKRLKSSEALAFFSAWEVIELDYLRESAPNRWSQLIPRYQAWSLALVRVQLPEGMSKTIKAKVFDLVYDRIQSGVIQSKQLLRAVRLLHDEEARRNSLEDFCSYNWVWGSDEQEQGDAFVGLKLKGYRLLRLQSGAKTSTRLYQAESEVRPQPGDRILCIPCGPDWTKLLQREIAADRAQLLCQAHDHHFLLYPGYATSLRARLSGNGMSPLEAWKMLRPVFLQVAAHHSNGAVSGCFSLKDIDWSPGLPCSLNNFNPKAYREAHREIQQGQGVVSEFFSAPEVLEQPEPTPASDQAVLGRILFEVIFGGRYPDHNLRVQLRLLGKPEANQAFSPYLERLKPIGTIFYRLCHANPSQRFANLQEAIEALDRAF